MSVPALGLRAVPVERYRGTPDDAPGTAIQDTGAMASPRGSGTRITSFRGRPGVEPRRPMLTLSTCRTPEDRAEGNDWSEEFGNPENRIDTIAVLETVRPARS